MLLWKWLRSLYLQEYEPKDPWMEKLNTHYMSLNAAMNEKIKHSLYELKCCWEFQEYINYTCMTLSGHTYILISPFNGWERWKFNSPGIPWWVGCWLSREHCCYALHDTGCQSYKWPSIEYWFCCIWSIGND